MKKVTSSIDSKISAQLEKSLANTSAELQLVNDLVDAHETALTQIKQENASVLSQARGSDSRLQKLEQLESKLTSRIAENEQAIQSIDAFRRSVNQEILKLKGG